MNLERLSPFWRMVAGAIGGISLGILFGLLFSLVIAWIAQQFSIGDVKEPMEYGIAVFFGMGAGAIVGGIMGGIMNSRK